MSSSRGRKFLQPRLRAVGGKSGLPRAGKSRVAAAAAEEDLSLPEEAQLERTFSTDASAVAELDGAPDEIPQVNPSLERFPSQFVEPAFTAAPPSGGTSGDDEEDAVPLFVVTEDMELWLHLFSFLPAVDLARLVGVCRTWYHLLLFSSHHDTSWFSRLRARRVEAVLGMDDTYSANARDWARVYGFWHHMRHGTYVATMGLNVRRMFFVFNERSARCVLLGTMHHVLLATLMRKMLSAHTSESCAGVCSQALLYPKALQMQRIVELMPSRTCCSAEMAVMRLRFRDQLAPSLCLMLTRSSQTVTAAALLLQRSRY
jgi:hypothetical protein